MTTHRQMSASLIVRVEQALAFGRSLDWMEQHLGAGPRIVDAARRRMDAAIADDSDWHADLPDGYDEITVAALCAGTTKIVQGGGRPNPDRDEAVRRLAAHGWTDRQIGDRIGMTAKGVMAARKRHGVTSGVPRPGSDGPSLRSLRGKAVAA